MTANTAAQPLIRSGARYTVEVGRCIVFGLLASAACAAGFFLAAGGMAWRHGGLVVVLCALVFPALYAVVGHQRGVARALASLARSNGGYLFDHTLGRFVGTLEARRPGAFVRAASSPRRLVQAFRLYLHERPPMPRQIRRVAVRYVDGVGGQLDPKTLADHDVVVDGRVNVAALRHVVVERMQGRFMPTWTTFVAVLLTQLVVTGALAWASR